MVTAEPNSIQNDSLIVMCSTLEEAQRQAFNNSSGGDQVLPVTVIRQGLREHLIVTPRLEELLNLGELNSATKKSNRTDVANVINRLVDKTHAKGIESYIAAAVNGIRKWILPSFIMSGKDGFRVYAYDSRGVKQGYLVVKAGVRLKISDGQHRFIGLTELKENYPDDVWPAVKDDFVVVDIVVEDDIDQIHQDFVDCGQTKPIQASLKKAWGQNDPHSRLTGELIARIPLFAGRIDVVSNTLGRDADMVLTISQLSLISAELMFGSTQTPRIRSGVNSLLRREASYGAALNRVVEFFEILSAHNDEWKKAADADNKIDFFRLRQDRIDFNSTGLQVVARAAHMIYTDASLSDQARLDLLKTLVGLDFRRRMPNSRGELVVNDASPFYGNVLSPTDGAILNRRNTIDEGVAATLEAVGYYDSTTPEGKRSRADRKEGLFATA
ncbi:MAG: DGQHR domain-containing protein [Alphaproteobacteria bacterium]|nr:MAG: DGQHR domain-containing protein [Alphaproteobacteria bacterium]